MPWRAGACHRAQVGLQYWLTVRRGVWTSGQAEPIERAVAERLPG